MKSHLFTRRDVLRGGGIALALPFLNNMSWAAGNTEKKKQPKRMMISYISYGVYDPPSKDGKINEWGWYPRYDSGPLTFNKASIPFEPLKDSVTYFRGLDHRGGYGLAGHASSDIFITGADMTTLQKTNNISIDQIAANANGHHTRYASLVLGSEGGTGPYGASKTLSYRGPAKPIPSLAKPQEIFNRLFLPYNKQSVNEVRASLKREASILDLMMDNYKSLNAKLGSEDSQKMEEYLDSVRAIEQRVERNSKWTYQELPKVDTKGLNLEATHHHPTDFIRCMYDLIYLAFQTDSTRYATFMTESEYSTDNLVGHFAKVLFGYKGNTHGLAHERPDGAVSGEWEKWRAEQHAYFLKRLRDTPEGDGNMLDNTLVLWGSAHPHGSHSSMDYPLQIAGGNKLGFKHGKLHNFEGPRKKPLANLFVSMLNAIDVPTEKFADSTGELTEVMG